jgi:ABC-type nitrate/sulfonate/bicarbonate transport system substrate-binding protein
LGFLLLASACGGGKPPAAVSSAPAAAAPAGAAAAAPAASAPAPAAPPAPTHVTVMFGTTSAQNSPFQLAEDQGIFAANGLEIEMAHAPGSAGPAALLAGQAPVLATGCVELVNAVAGGGDFVMWLQTTDRMQYMLAGGQNVATVADLRGKRLAISRVGADSHLATKFILSYLGLDPEQDATYVQVGNTPDRVAALLSGSVDATILSSDEGALMANVPGMRIIVDMTREELPYCATSLMTMRSYVRENPDVVRRLTRAFVEATARYKQNKAEGMAAVARFLNESDPVKVEHVWDTWQRLFVAKPYPNARGIQFIIDQAGQSDERIRALTPEQISDATWVRELDESGFIDGLYRAPAAP